MFQNDNESILQKQETEVFEGRKVKSTKNERIYDLATQNEIDDNRTHFPPNPGKLYMYI